MLLADMLKPKRNQHFQNGFNAGFGVCSLIVGLYISQIGKIAIALILVGFGLLSIVTATLLEWHLNRNEIRKSQADNFKELIG